MCKNSVKQDFEIAITNDILSEYEEVISKKYSEFVAENVIRTLLLLPNVVQTTIYYKWNIIDSDKDDNKFVDCAIVANADAIITRDKHFNILKEIDFPPINIMNIKEFKEFLNNE